MQIRLGDRSRLPAPEWTPGQIPTARYRQIRGLPSSLVASGGRLSRLNTETTTARKHSRDYWGARCTPEEPAGILWGSGPPGNTGTNRLLPPPTTSQIPLGARRTRAKWTRDFAQPSAVGIMTFSERAAPDNQATIAILHTGACHTSSKTRATLPGSCFSMAIA